MPAPSWQPSASYGVAVLSKANGRLARDFIEVCAPYYDSYRFPGIFTDFSGGVLLKSLGTHGAWAFIGTGHGSGNDNTTPGLVEGDVCDWRRWNDPSPVFGSTNDPTTQGNNAFANFNPYLTDPYTASPDAGRLDVTTGAFVVDGQIAGCHSYGVLHEVFARPGEAARIAMLAVPAATAINPPIHSVLCAHELSITSLAQPSSARRWKVAQRHPLPAGSGAWAAPNGLGFAPAGYPSMMTPTNDATLPKLQGIAVPLCAVYDARRRRSMLVSRTPGPLRIFDWTTRRWWYSTSAGMPNINADDPGFAWVVLDAPELMCAFFIYRSPAAGNKLRIKVLDYMPEEPVWSGNVAVSADISVRTDWSSAAWNPAKGLIAVGDLLGNNQAIAEVVVPPRDSLTSGTYTVTQRTLDTPITAWQKTVYTADNANGYGKMAWNPATDCYAAWDIARGQPDVLYRIRA